MLNHACLFADLLSVFTKIKIYFGLYKISIPIGKWVIERQKYTRCMHRMHRDARSNGQMRDTPAWPLYRRGPRCRLFNVASDREDHMVAASLYPTVVIGAWEVSCVSSARPVIQHSTTLFTPRCACLSIALCRFCRSEGGRARCHNNASIALRVQHVWNSLDSRENTLFHSPLIWKSYAVGFFFRMISLLWVVSRVYIILVSCNMTLFNLYISSLR